MLEKYVSNFWGCWVYPLGKHTVVLSLHVFTLSLVTDSHDSLNHWGRVMHTCVNKLCHHWFRYWFVAWSAPSHHLNHCGYIDDWTPRNIFMWNSNKNKMISMHENAFENVCEMATILSRPRCVNTDSLRITTIPLNMNWGIWLTGKN